MAVRLAADLRARTAVLLELGLGYLSLGRTTTTLSPGETQRLRIATQLRSGLFGVVYVLDEPSAGLHPADAEPLLDVLDRLKAAGNSLFVVEHDLDVVRRADWVVDLGPGAGQHGGQVLYSGPVAGLEAVAASRTGDHLFRRGRPSPRPQRTADRARSGCAASAATTSTRSTSPSPPACSPPSPGCPAPASPPWSRRCSPASCAPTSGQPADDPDLLADATTTRTRRTSRCRTTTGTCDRRRTRASPRPGWRLRPGRAGRPAADRPDAAQQPRDLHRAVRRGTADLRRDGGGPRPRLRRGPVLLQRRRGTLRDLPGRGLRRRRAAVPARHVRRRARPATASATTRTRSR